MSARHCRSPLAELWIRITGGPAPASVYSRSKAPALSTGMVDSWDGARLRNALPLSRLADLEAFDLARLRQVKSEVGAEVAPPVGMERSGDVEPVVLDTLDRREALVAERVLGEFLQRARTSVVVERCFGLKQRRPRFAVAFL